MSQQNHISEIPQRYKDLWDGCYDNDPANNVINFLSLFINPPEVNIPNIIHASVIMLSLS